MENLYIVLFLIFLFASIAVFVLPSQFLKNKTIPEIKKTKIGLIMMTIIFFVLFGVTSDASKQNKTQTNHATTQNSPAPTNNITYKVIKSWEIPNGGFGKVIVISPEYFNLSDLTLLGEKLKNDLKSDRNSFIFIFDDLKAANMRDTVLSTDINNIPKENQDYYDKHYIGEYAKNGNTHYHQLTIYFDGVTGTNQQIIKY